MSRRLIPAKRKKLSETQTISVPGNQEAWDGDDSDVDMEALDDSSEDGEDFENAVMDRLDELGELLNQLLTKFTDKRQN